MKSEKEFADRVESLRMAGSTLESAQAAAKKEFRAINEARRAIYRKAAIRKEKRHMREIQIVTPQYGLSSRVGKIDPFSKHNKPSKGLAELRRDLANTSR